MGCSLSQGKEVRWIAAFGWGGQRIFIIPELDMVVMMTSGLFGRPKEGLAQLDILANVIIPSAREKP
jgi:CubicO group peptidase (beta-lactamase class C family)